ncbi:MAG: hypothetical protein M3459_13325 [Actinomycetota bacterium]|nr:hypothetical protein [Actinomycetota bacterium]
MADERNDADRDVLSRLPSSRPARRSARRADREVSPAVATPGAGGRKRTAPERPPPAKARAAGTRHRVPPAGYATPEPERTSPGTGELLGGAVRAGGEVAKLGADVGGRLVKGTLRRLTGR